MLCNIYVYECNFKYYKVLMIGKIEWFNLWKDNNCNKNNNKNVSVLNVVLFEIDKWFDLFIKCIIRIKYKVMCCDFG